MGPFQRIQQRRHQNNECWNNSNTNQCVSMPHLSYSCPPTPIISNQGYCPTLPTSQFIPNSVDQRLGIGPSENIVSKNELLSKVKDNGNGTLTLSLDIPASQQNILFSVSRNGQNIYHQLSSYEMGFNSQGNLSDSMGAYSVSHHREGNMNHLNFTISKDQVEGARISFSGRTYRVVPSELTELGVVTPPKPEPVEKVEYASPVHSIDLKKTPEQRASATRALDNIAELGNKIGVEAKQTKAEEILHNLEKFQAGLKDKTNLEKPVLESMLILLDKVSEDVAKSVVDPSESVIKGKIDDKISVLKNNVQYQLNRHDGVVKPVDKVYGGGVPTEEEKDPREARKDGGSAEYGGGVTAKEDDPRTTSKSEEYGGGAKADERKVDSEELPEEHDPRTKQSSPIEAGVSRFISDIARVPNGRGFKPRDLPAALVELQRIENFDDYRKFSTLYSQKTGESFSDAFSKFGENEKSKLVDKWFGQNTKLFLENVIEKTQVYLMTDENGVKEVANQYNATNDGKVKYEEAWNLLFKPYYKRTLSEQISQAQDNWW